MKTEELTRTIAMYQSDYGSIHTVTVGCAPDSWICVSEPLTVTFKPIPQDVIVAGIVSVIDAQIEKERTNSFVRITRLEQRKAELLALPAPESA